MDTCGHMSGVASGGGGRQVRAQVESTRAHSSWKRVGCFRLWVRLCLGTPLMTTSSVKHKGSENGQSLRAATHPWLRCHLAGNNWGSPLDWFR